MVLGGAGFLGSHLVERLLADGAAHVTAVDNFITGDAKNLAGLSAEGRFTLLEHDITEGLPVAGPVDFVFNLASPASPIDYAEKWLETMRVGSLGTENGLHLAEEKKAVFFQASTSEIYGDPLVHPQPESYFGNVDSTGPRAVYDEAKRYAEALVQAFRRKRGVSTRIVRIFNTYGPRMRLNDGRVVPAFIGQALKGQPFTIFGDGRQTRSFCYVDDLIDGFARLALGEMDPVNIGGPDEEDDARVRGAVQSAAGTSAVRLPALAAGRPETASARHHPGENAPGVGTQSAPGRRSEAHHRVFSSRGVMRPKWFRLTRQSFDQPASVLVPWGEGESLVLPPLEWLPGDVHRFEVDSTGAGAVSVTEQRRRPARVPLFNGRALSFRSTPRVAHGDCVSFGEDVTATFLDAEVHDAELEARLGVDEAARAVYADVLAEQGDPFGEAIALAGPTGAPPSWVLHETRWPGVEVDVEWRHGFADEVYVSLLDASVFPSGIMRVLNARVCGVPSSLTLRIDVAHSVTNPLDQRLALHLPTSLRVFQLVLGQRDAPARVESDRLLDAVRRRCPRVEAAVMIDPTRAEPSAERLRLNLRGPTSGA